MFDCESRCFSHLTHLLPFFAILKEHLLKIEQHGHLYYKYKLGITYIYIHNKKATVYIYICIHIYMYTYIYICEIYTWLLDDSFHSVSISPSHQFHRSWRSWLCGLIPLKVPPWIRRWASPRNSPSDFHVFFSWFLNVWMIMLDGIMIGSSWLW